MPGALRAIVDRQDVLYEYFDRSKGDLAVASSLAFSDALAAAETMALLAAPYDALDVLESVRLSLTPLDFDSYQESEEEPGFAMIELCALLLAARGIREGTLPMQDGHRVRADDAIADILQALREIIRSVGLVPMLGLVSTGSAVDSLQRGMILREMFVRTLAYPHMVEASLRRLFDEPSIAEICRDSLGCTVAEILAVFDTLAELHQDNWRQRFEVMGTLRAELREEWQTYAESPENYEANPELREQTQASWDAAWTDPADASDISVEAIASATGLTTAVVSAVLQLFSCDFKAESIASAFQTFVDGRSPFRTRPVVRSDDGAIAVVHVGALTSSIRPRIEQVLKGTPAWEQYQKQRGYALETEAVDLIASIFREADAYRNLEYFVPDPDSSAVQVHPDQFTKLVEGDGLVVVDDVAIIIEGKSGAFGDSARSGQAVRLKSDLEKIVSSAAEQANRTRERIEVDCGLRLRSNDWLDLSHIREIHSIAVSLEDLSGIATVTSDLVLAGLISTPYLPWIVSVHDLRVVSELVERPSEFLLYLRRRNEPSVTRKFRAIDELDFFLEFYQSGLYVEPDPERLKQELPQFGEPSVASTRRFKNQRVTFLTSRTDALDAWYFHELGLRSTPAPKPRFKPNIAIAGLVDWMAVTQLPGWLRVGATLFDASGKLQTQLAGLPRLLTSKTAVDGSFHSYTMIGGARFADSFVMAFASLGSNETTQDAIDRWRRYLRAKKHQVGVAYGVLLLFDGVDGGRPVGMIYDSVGPGPSPELDNLVKEFKLRPPQQMTHTFGRQSMKPSGRVTPKGLNTAS